MSRRKRTVLEMGFDSFLDIVANLVGILIILVVILGTRSREVAEEAVRNAVENSAESHELRRSLAQAHAAREAVDHLRGSLSSYELEIHSRRRERDVLMDMLAVSREAWEKNRDHLSADQKRAASLAATEAASEKELNQLTGERIKLQEAEGPTVAVEHLPSPMAKTVFGDEIHLRLKGGHLSVIPLESLVGAIRDEFRRGTNGTRIGTAESVVGPIRGYIAKYEMEKSRATINRGNSVGVAVRMELTHMTLEPVNEADGLPLAAVLSNPQSILDVELAGRDPATTTVTVWVYPDSFAEFRTLKEHLYARGIATAARPLPEGHPISGGPQGSRSAAQ